MSLLLGWLMMSCVELDENTESAYSELKINITAEGSKEGDKGDAIFAGGLRVDDLEIGFGDLRMNYLSEAGINSGMDKMQTLDFSDQNHSGSPMKLVEKGMVQANFLGNDNTPNGLYQDASVHLNNELVSGLSHSLKLIGNLDGKEVLIWLENEEWINAKAINANAYSIYENSELELVFDLEKLFEGLNMDYAIDGNNNGLIEIGPHNEDGNQELFLEIEGNLRSALRLRK